MSSVSNGKDLPRVAVTGATGLVGGHLAVHLAERGYPVVAIVRDPAKPACKVLTAAGVELSEADVLNRDSIDKALHGCRVIVHAAGTVDPLGSREDIFRTNVGGTKIVLDSAKQNGLEQFIFVSSLSVITGQGDQYDVDESAPLRLCGESYADSKVEAERLVMAEAGKGGDSHDARMKVTAVRPGFIYGPGERAWMPRLIGNIAAGKAMLIDGGKKETNVIFVGNLSNAIEAAILNERAYGEVYNLTDGEKISKKELFDAIADGLSLPRVKKKIPGVVAKAVCEVVSTVAPRLSKEKQRELSRFSRAAFRLAGVNQGFCIAKAERDLGYNKRLQFSQAMSETLEHFQAPGKASAGGAAGSVAAGGTDNDREASLTK